MNKLFNLCTLIQGHTVYQFPLSYLTQRGAERKWAEGSIRFDPSIFIYPYVKFMGSLKKKRYAKKRNWAEGTKKWQLILYYPIQYVDLNG